MSLSKQLYATLVSQKIALFLDIDGTLVDFCDDAENVRLPEQLLNDLAALFIATDGALALVSGRPIEQIDKLTAPFQFPAAGGHGAHYRLSKTVHNAVKVDSAVIKSLYLELTKTLAELPLVIIETKPQGLAVHFRRCPQFQRVIESTLVSLLSQYPDFSLQPGKAVLEIKPQGIDKGQGIATFLLSEKFLNHCPVFIGDDLTDEAGFAVVNRINGISVKVGTGPTVANYRLKNVAAVQDLIHQLRHYFTGVKNSSGVAICKG